ncbi:hypothetical protein WICPIJ_002424 [Wickerhamomyces pijperi]|uniref:Uncharacterized protein n=1 Tax=Wickerhamomyces pijperi TaxID=599730 RepID=A0A9P8QBG4_WICPI|nr:hypothetical protein WICPIJ_002424 [Wickerhamomyces pijperi]
MRRNYWSNGSSPYIISGYGIQNFGLSYILTRWRILSESVNDSKTKSSPNLGRFKTARCEMQIQDPPKTGAWKPPIKHY